MKQKLTFTHALFYTTGNMARLLDCDIDTVRTMILRKKLPVIYSPGGHMRIYKHVAHAYLRKHGYPVPMETA